MAKKGTAKRDFVTRALKRVGLGLVGKIPVAGVVLKGLIEAGLETAAAQSPSGVELHARFAEMAAERACDDVEAISQVLLELAGEAPDKRGEIEKLAEAVRDPEGLEKHERLRAAMERLFETAGKATDDLEELAKAIETHIHVEGCGAVGQAEQHIEGGFGFQGGVHHHYYGESKDDAPSEAKKASSERDARIAPTRLPTTGALLLGRNRHFKMLDGVWEEGSPNVVVFVAEGGVGKTALVRQWRASMAKDGFRGAACVYDHSFYSQGTSDRTASADVFIREALAWFGDADPDAGSAWAKGSRLAGLIGAQRGLLILDGVEPLQDPESGHINDPGLRALVLGLADVNVGLCVVTTRQKLADLSAHERKTVRTVNLDNLTKATGGRLLKELGVGGTKEEREDASVKFGNHALTLTLLGTFLKRAHHGDVRKWRDIDLVEADAKSTHKGHAHKVMASYEKWLLQTGHKMEVSILRMMGLFSRPADAGCIRALRREPVIVGLTDGVVGASEADWNIAVSLLRELRLLAEASEQNPGELDAHPLIREHFAERLRENDPEAWRSGHERLYEYLTSEEGCPKEFPDTLEEMQPLFAAVVHGCHAGRHQEVFTDLYWRRINREEEFYSGKKIGAFGAVLGALTGFFDNLWMIPVATIEGVIQGYVLNDAAYALQALGRPADAVEPLKAGIEVCIQSDDWANAAIGTQNLSRLLLKLGDIRTAVELAERSIGHANLGGDWIARMFSKTGLANALHQGGQVELAERTFREAESMQVKAEAGFPRLYSMQGFEFCDLLLGKGDAEQVIERATTAISWYEQEGQEWLLDIGLDRLSLGRAYLARARERQSVETPVAAKELIDDARTHMTTAVDGLRKSGQVDELPRGLLGWAELCTFTGEYDEARAALREAMSIATRDPKGPMRLFVTDCHLGYARVALAEGETGAKETAATHLAEARRLIEETGYHQRDGELAELEALVG